MASLRRWIYPHVFARTVTRIAFSESNPGATSDSGWNGGAEQNPLIGQGVVWPSFCLMQGQDIMSLNASRSYRTRYLRGTRYPVPVLCRFCGPQRAPPVRRGEQRAGQRGAILKARHAHTKPAIAKLVPCTGGRG